MEKEPEAGKLEFIARIQENDKDLKGLDNTDNLNAIEALWDLQGKQSTHYSKERQTQINTELDKLQAVIAVFDKIRNNSEIPRWEVTIEGITFSFPSDDETYVATKFEEDFIDLYVKKKAKEMLLEKGYLEQP